MGKIDRKSSMGLLLSGLRLLEKRIRNKNEWREKKLPDMTALQQAVTYEKMAEARAVLNNIHSIREEIEYLGI